MRSREITAADLGRREAERYCCPSHGASERILASDPHAGQAVAAAAAAQDRLHKARRTPTVHANFSAHSAQLTVYLHKLHNILLPPLSTFSLSLAVCKDAMLERNLCNLCNLCKDAWSVGICVPSH